MQNNNVYKKLLSIKLGNSVIIYEVRYEENQIKNLAKFINQNYSMPEKEIVNTSFLDHVPTSFGICDKSKLYKINKYEILSLNQKVDETIDKNDLLYFPQAGYGQIKVVYDKLTQLATIIEDTFLTDDNYVLLDMTDLIKYRNSIYNINNAFRFDKTIDLALKNKKTRTKWLSKIDTFITMEDYNDHIKRLAYNLNEHIEFINSKEEKKMINEIGGFLGILHGFFDIEEIAMFPSNSSNDESIQIIERYANRNAECNFYVNNSQFSGWFGSPLDNAEINYDGGNILNDYKQIISKTYDLDGQEYDMNAVQSIKKNQYIKEYSILKKN